jgi:hypothetical protein
VAPNERPADPSPPGRASGRPNDLRADYLHDAFYAPDDRLETTLPPDDPEADLARGSVTFFWRTQRGIQPVIMPLWRRLD